MSVSYPNLRRGVAVFVAALQLPWRKTQRDNLVRLASAFLASRSFPLRRLARVISGPGTEQRHSDKRLRRFVGNELLDLAGALEALLKFLLPRFGDVPHVPIVLDWTFIGTTYAVLWAQIPYRGRSFPLWAHVCHYRGLGDTTTEIALLAAIDAVWPPNGPRPLLLADRGFPKAALLTWLQEHGWRYVIRGKSNQPLRRAPADQPCHAYQNGNVRCYPGLIWLTEPPVPLSLVICRRADRVTQQPWRLYTNLPTAELPWAVRLYRQRMQPEQTHRDCKHGHFVSGYGLAHLKRLRIDRVERLLFCLGLVYAYLVLLAETERDTRQWLINRHWGLSLATFALDLIDSLGRQLAKTTKQALASVRLQPLWFETGDS